MSKFELSEIGGQQGLLVSLIALRGKQRKYLVEEKSVPSN